MRCRFASGGVEGGGVCPSQTLGGSGVLDIDAGTVPPQPTLAANASVTTQKLVIRWVTSTEFGLP